MLKQDMLELAEIISTSVVTALEQKGLVGTAPANAKSSKTAYQRTEQLLYNYRGFKRIVEERMQEIEDIRRYGVPNRGAMGERVQNGNLPKGIVLPEEAVEAAVRTVERSVDSVVKAIEKIDKALLAIGSDYYAKIIQYRYFDGRTQEDIALEFGVSQVTISNNNSRLIRELSIRLFPNQAVEEMFL